MINHIADRFKKYTIELLISYSLLSLLIILPLLSPIFLIVLILSVIGSFIFLLVDDCKRYAEWEYYQICNFNIPIFYRWRRDQYKLDYKNSNKLLNSLKNNILIIYPDNTIKYGVRYDSIKYKID